jgi:hypothetical protein
VPLTKSGSKVKRNMQSEYGARKGASVFYASINKGKPGSSKWHRKTGKAAPIQRSMMSRSR